MIDKILRRLTDDDGYPYPDVHQVREAGANLNELKDKLQNTDAHINELLGNGKLQDVDDIKSFLDGVNWLKEHIKYEEEEY